MLSKLKRVLIPLIVITVLALSACATAQVPVFDPNKSEITKTVNGQTFVLGWEASSGTSTVDQSKVPLCLVYYMIKGGGQATFKPVGGECSAEKIIELVETWKSTIPESDNTGQRE